MVDFNYLTSTLVTVAGFLKHQQDDHHMIQVSIFELLAGTVHLGIR